ncbi:MAG: SlyX protein [Massilia sp.]|jgi:SlyX protein|nr:SlyX protein [Massilia sp.]MDB5951995.1 SlyX protein [Massilia sp.]
MAAFAPGGHAVSIPDSSEDRFEDRFVDIEIKLAHQEDTVEQLNGVVYEQSRRIDQLEAMLSQLAEHIRNNAQSGPNLGAGGEKPPHY